MKLTIDGITANVKQHCKRLGISYSTVINYVMKFKLEHRDVIEFVHAKKLEKNNRPSLCALAKQHGLKSSTVVNRIRRNGWTLEQALNTRILKRGETIERLN